MVKPIWNFLPAGKRFIYPEGMTVPERFAEVAARFVDHFAVVDRSNHLSYRELVGIAAAAEKWIRGQAKLEKGPIAVCLKDRVDLFGFFLGIMQSGRAYLYLDPDDAPARRQALLKKSRAVLLLAEESSPFFSLPQITPAHFLDGPTELSTGSPVLQPDREMASCCLVQTSGSTNQPQGFSISHRTLLHNVDNFRATLALTSDDRVGLLASPKFTAANSAIYGALLSGAVLHPFSVRDRGLAAWMEWIRNERITVLHLTPSLFRKLAQDAEPGSFPTVRVIKLGGEPAYRSDAELFRAKFPEPCLLVNGLGLSETGGNICHYVWPRIEPLTGETIPVGRALPGHEIRVRTEKGDWAKAEEEGEIVVRSSYLAEKNWGTRKGRIFRRFNIWADPLELSTGDRGRLSAEGNLIHLGRKDRLVKIRGFRVDLNEVEAALLRQSEIGNVAVTLEKRPDHTAFLVAWIEAARRKTVELPFLRRALAENGPGYMVPQHFVILPRLPLTVHGKIDRQQLQWSKAGPASRDSVAPRTEIEMRLTVLWQDVLKNGAMGIYDNFFEAGGDSLMAMELVMRLAQEFGPGCSLPLLINHPTIAQMAEAIAAGFAEEETSPGPRKFQASLLRLRAGETEAPLIFFPGGYASENELLVCASLLPYLHRAGPVYGVRLNLLARGVRPPISLSGLARWVKRAVKRQESVPPILIGECLGCSLALETARQWEQATGQAPLLLLLNPWHPVKLSSVGPSGADSNPAVAKYFDLIKGRKPSGYGGTIHLVCDAERAEVCREWWSRHVGPLRQIHIVPGDHHSYIRQYRKELAKTLDAIWSETPGESKKTKKFMAGAGKAILENTMNVISQRSDAWLGRPGPAWFHEKTMKRYGIRNLMRLAKTYNRWRYGARARRHERAYAEEGESLLREHGGSFPPRVTMQDGWAIDTSRSLPGLERLLEQAAEVVRERSGKKYSDTQLPYFRNLFFLDDLQTYPAFLDFVLSPEVLATVMHYLKTVPVLSKTRPPGLRFMESNQNLDPNPPGPWSESQLYHLDLHDTPLVYVIVLIEDVSIECGPWTFLPASVSEKAARALGYQKRGQAYRVTDEEMYGVIDRSEAIEFSYPKGTVLFIDSSRCFHYGSRLSYRPRFQMMYAYTSVCRSDFSQTFMRPFPYPVALTDSRLRKMVLE